MRFLRAEGFRWFLLLAAAMASRQAQAVVIAYEPFDYPASSNLSSNAGGTGWVGSWIYSPLISNHGTINPTNLVYGKLSYAGKSLRTAANNGIDNRDFRKLNTTNTAVAPWIDANGKFGKSGTTLWIAFLARLGTSSNSGNGGIHLYDGLGDLSLSNDGDKANHERMFMGDRASGTFWFIGRTCGGCPCALFMESTNTVNGTLHLFAYRYDFIGTNVDVRLFIDPPLTNTPPNASAAAALIGLCGFDFDWVEVGSGSESLDIDEFRIATSFAEAAPLDTPKLTASPVNNAMRIKLTGLPTRTYAIQSTADFLGWTTLTNGSSDTNGVLQFDDTNFPVTPARFYRGVFP
jgi:hypothetical protein